MGKGHALCATTIPHSSSWLLDSSASHHMASSQDFFSSFEALHILMGNNTIFYKKNRFYKDPETQELKHIIRLIISS